MSKTKICSYLTPVLFFILLECVLELESWQLSTSLSILKPALWSFGLYTAFLLILLGYLLKTSPEIFQLKVTAKGISCLILCLLLFFGNAFLTHVLSSPTSASSSQTVASILGNSRVNPLAYSLWITNIALIGPLVEELLCRGLLMTRHFKDSPIYLDVIVSAIVFSAFHVISSPWNWLLFIHYLIPGTVFALLFKKSRSIWPSATLHIIWNGLLVLLSSL